MPSLTREQLDEERAVETLTVDEMMDGFRQLYNSMAGDPCLDDLASAIKDLMIELDDRRNLAMLVAAEEDQELRCKSLH
ncbi:MAG: hypothetical protein AAGI06_12920 [Pseudomonadota bacterium]